MVNRKPTTNPERDQRIEAVVQARHGPRVAAELERQPRWARDLTDLSYEWRRLFSELFGTFLLVLAGAGAPVVAAKAPGQISRIAEVTAPA